MIGSRGDAHLSFGATVADRGQEACEARDAFTRTPDSFWCPAGLCGDGGGGSAGCGGQEPVATGPNSAAAAEVTVGAAGSCAAGSRERSFKCLCGFGGRCPTSAGWLFPWFLIIGWFLLWRLRWRSELAGFGTPHGCS